MKTVSELKELLKKSYNISSNADLIKATETYAKMEIGFMTNRGEKDEKREDAVLSDSE